MALPCARGEQYLRIAALAESEHRNAIFTPVVNIPIDYRASNLRVSGSKQRTATHSMPLLSGTFRHNAGRLRRIDA